MTAEPAGGGGEGSSPLLDLTGFSGRLERLLALARARRIELARIALPALVDQLIAALRQASGRTPLALQADWVVMAAWLVQLRSRLLRPANAAGQDAANRDAAQLRRGLARLGAVQAAACWLDEQPQLGRDVFPRGQPELVGTGTATRHQVDVIEFLWASLALFDDDLPGPDTMARYRPLWLDLHTIPDARDRILRRMAGHQTPAGSTSCCRTCRRPAPRRTANCGNGRAGPAPSRPASSSPSRARWSCSKRTALHRSSFMPVVQKAAARTMHNGRYIIDSTDIMSPRSRATPA